LAQHILVRHCRKLGRPLVDLDTEALAALQRHPFRGNIRELENLLERALLLCEPGLPIMVDDLFDDLPGPVAPTDDAAPEATIVQPGTSTLQADVLRFEADRLRTVLAECGGNKSEAARRLGLTRNGLLKKLARCGVS
jgi:DNA-binding NtrC family response regulator